MCICCSVPTEVIVKLLPSVLVCFPSLTMSSILPVWTLLRPRLELSETQEDWERKGEDCWQSSWNMVGVGWADWGKRRCRVGKLSIACVRHSGVGHLALTAAAVAGNGIPKGRWECCDVFAHAQFLPCCHACTKAISSCTSPFPIFFPISHRISVSSMQQSCEELEQVRSEKDGYEWEHFESWSNRSLEEGICGLTMWWILKENCAFSSYSFLLLLGLSGLSLGTCSLLRLHRESPLTWIPNHFFALCLA